MREMCPSNLTYCDWADLRRRRPPNRGNRAWQTNLVARSSGTRRLRAEHQKPVRNPYPRVPRPPQTQAAQFKRLYRK
jgi:hypothetical protein